MLVESRLENQILAFPREGKPEKLLAYFGAIQGQDYSGAKWSLGLRLLGTTDSDIEQAIIDKKILRTWVMRGTLHLTAAEDVRWLVELVGQRIIQQSQYRYRQLELDDVTFHRCHDLILNALAGGKQRTRRQLLAYLEENGVSTAGQRGIHILRRTSLEGLIVQGTVDNNNPNFMRIDEALPDASSTKPREEALAELAKRYFTSRGPATVDDFVWWSGLTKTDARFGLEAVLPQLSEETIGENQYWFSANSTYPETSSIQTSHTPPGFDEYLLGYKVRDDVLAPEHATKVCPGKNGVFYPTIVINGQIVGTWKRAFKKSNIEITPSPFEPLNKNEQTAFATSIQRFGDFHEMPVNVNF